MLLRLLVILLFITSVARAADPINETANPMIERDCERLFGDPQRFLSARTWRKEAGIEPAFFVEPEEMRVILHDQRRILVRGFHVGIVVIDQYKLHNTVISETIAKYRILTYLNQIIRITMGHISTDLIEDYDFIKTLTKSDHRFSERLGEMGLRMALIDTTNATFNLGLAPCEDPLR